MWAHSQQGACPLCMPSSTTNVQNCQGQPPAVFEKVGPKGSAPRGSQGAVQPWEKGQHRDKLHTQPVP